jgi:threonine/homoserine/homoserine lactone efflux protein
MPSTETLMTFLSVSVLLALVPGPDNIFVLTQSALSGRKVGFAVTVGLCLGLVVHTAAVAFGVAAIVQSSALAFSLLKLTGAGYLAYLAVKAFRARPSDLENDDLGKGGLARMVGRGFIMNITNPKVLLFFLALLPQFVEPGSSVAFQVLALGVVFMLVTLVVFGGVAAFSGTLGSFLKRSERAQVVLHRVAGAVFLGLALTLVTMHR